MTASGAGSYLTRWGVSCQNEGETAGVVALSDGLYWLHLGDGALIRIAELEIDLPKISSMTASVIEPVISGSAVSTGRTQSFPAICTALIPRAVSRACLTASASPTASVGRRTMPFATTQILRNRPSGRCRSLKIGLRLKRVFVKDVDGYPDGLTVDAEGTYGAQSGTVVAWFAIHPKATSKPYYKCRCRGPTSLMFGGDDLSQLFITSAKADAQEPMGRSRFRLPKRYPGTCRNTL